MLTRLAHFVRDVFPPAVYLTYAILWSLAFEGSVALLSQDQQWDLSWRTAARALTLYLMIFCYRLIDEEKDLDYDRVHQPDRPLVVGSVHLRDLRIALLATAGVVLLMNVFVAPLGVLVLAVALIWALTLLVLERRSPRVRDGLFVNLAVTYPVQLLLSVYLAVSLLTGSAHIDHGPGAARVTALCAVFAAAFLHFEFARKTAWSVPAGARYYSTVVGPTASAGLALLAALVAVGLSWVLFAGRAPYWAAALVTASATVPAWGGFLFLRRRVQSWPKALGMAFIVVAYLALVVQAWAGTHGGGAA